ncbi:MAG TPA: methylmalonyl-CoA mutase family protein [Marinilabiliaceae bacterium]|nr:methylmalonyl-CoA mutase family protein [Marinilabiliaceae bacterium]
MTDKSNQPLFQDFPPVSTQEWMDRVTADLKGADFEKRLVWKTDEGFSVQPFYREEDLKSLNYLNTLPGEFPYVRGTKTNNHWLVRQEIYVADVVKANEKAVELISKGVDSFGFVFEDKNLFTKESISILLENITDNNIELNFSNHLGKLDLIQLVTEVLKEQKRDLTLVQGSVNFDPLGQLTIKGKCCVSTDELLKNSVKIVNSNSELPKFQSLTVNAKHFNNAGATIVQELGFGLSMANEYLANLVKSGMKANQAAKQIRFNFGIGGNYFMEIAKLRAARLLWAKIVEAYEPEDKEAAKMVIHCETSEWNKTIYDPYVNMLRTQTEAMSASLGGTDSLTVQSFDKIFRQPNDFSERIARNQQLLLKEESYFDKIADPAAGSYYIENITNSIVEEAWKLFIEVEEKGGYIEALKAGFIQECVKEAADIKSKKLAQRRSTLLGTNQYPNTSEKVASTINEDRVFSSSLEKGIVEPIKLFRGAEEFEALRLATEKADKRPKVFMLTFGNLAMRLARSQFSGNFFGCAGYEIIDNLGFETPEEGVEAALKANADIVVLCSSDSEYAEAAPAAFKALNGKALFVVAGAPPCMDDLKSQGIEHFIHVRSNLLETLQFFNDQLIK